MKKNILLIIIISALMSGCTRLNVKPIPAEHNINHLCIEENRKVKVSDFLQTLIDRLQYHRITSTVIQSERKYDCVYTLKYTALRNWDIVPYLWYAKLWVVDAQNRQIAEGEFSLKNRGGLSLAKFEGTPQKIYPLIDRLVNKMPQQ